MKKARRAQEKKLAAQRKAQRQAEFEQQVKRQRDLMAARKAVDADGRASALPALGPRSGRSETGSSPGSAGLGQSASLSAMPPHRRSSLEKTRLEGVDIAAGDGGFGAGGDVGRGRRGSGLGIAASPPPASYSRQLQHNGFGLNPNSKASSFAGLPSQPIGRRGLAPLSSSSPSPGGGRSPGGGGGTGNPPRASLLKPAMAPPTRPLAPISPVGSFSTSKMLNNLPPLHSRAAPNQLPRLP